MLESPCGLSRPIHDRSLTDRKCPEIHKFLAVEHSLQSLGWEQCFLSMLRVLCASVGFQLHGLGSAAANAARSIGSQPQCLLALSRVLGSLPMTLLPKSTDCN